MMTSKSSRQFGCLAAFTANIPTMGMSAAATMFTDSDFGACRVEYTFFSFVVMLPELNRIIHLLLLGEMMNDIHVLIDYMSALSIGSHSSSLPGMSDLAGLGMSGFTGASGMSGYGASQDGDGGSSQKTTEPLTQSQPTQQSQGGEDWAR